MADAETVLVTGASGFIGGWCAATLLSRGYRVRATVRALSREPAARAAIGKACDPQDRLSFVAAELTDDAGWDAAAEGCAYVLHVASPLGVENPKDPQVLIKPARDGALRVLRAAGRAGVSRVVMTSSVAAASPPPSSGDTLTDETQWTDPTLPGVGAYPQSKTFAEQAAWAFMAEQGGATTLAVVNPALVLGPILSTASLGSVQVVQRLMNGSMPGTPRLGFNIVDVRDVADLHLRAMVAPAAAGQRFIAAGDYAWMADIAAMLREHLGVRAGKVPTRALPDIVLRLIAVFDPALRTVTPGLSRKHAFSSNKAQDVLGWAPRSLETTVVECAESLIANARV